MQCMTEDKLRDEAQRLMMEKEEYQEIAKDTLKKLVDEKLEAVRKMQDLEKQLSNTEDEFTVMKELYERNVEESKALATELTNARDEVEALRSKIPPPPPPPPPAPTAAATTSADDDSGTARQPIQPSDLAAAKAESAIIDNEASQQETIEEEAIQRAEDEDATMSNLQEDASASASELEISEASSIASVSEATTCEPLLVAVSGADAAELEDLRARLAQVSAREEALQEDFRRSREQWEGERAAWERNQPVKVLEERDSRSDEINDLMEQLAQSKATLEALEAELKDERQRAATMQERLTTSTATSFETPSEAAVAAPDLDSSSASLNESLHEAEEKITQLLKVKERFAEVTQTNARLETSVAELEREVEKLGMQSQTATACAVVPIAVLLLAFIVTYMPTLASLFGTAESV